MNISRQRELTQQVLTMIQTGATPRGQGALRLPAEHYCAESQAELERQRIFSRAPVCVGPSNVIRHQGDYVITSLNGKSVIVIRDASGQARAFLNSCRHRGAPLLSESKGHVRHLICPYHHWCYDTQGTLASAGKSDCYQSLSAEESGLISLPITEQGGFIWLAEQEEGLQGNFLPSGIMNELAEFGFEDYHPFSCTPLARQMNWKLGVDTFLESWHFNALHKNTISSAFFSGPGTLVTHEGYGIRLIYPRRTVTSLADNPDGNLLKHVAIIWLIFPGTLLLWQKDHLESWHIEPGPTPGECRAQFRIYTREPATAKTRPIWEKNLDIQMRTADAEDFALMVQIQRNLSSGTTRDILFGDNEPALVAFHQNLLALTGSKKHAFGI